MNFRIIIEPVLLQLAESLQALTPEQYSRNSKVLNNSTIGGHTRHVIELFQCLINGYHEGLVNYEKRKRDLVIETDNALAENLIYQVINAIDKPNKPLILEGCFSVNTYTGERVDSNFYRELIYNLEHTIHHMALIRIGMNEISNITLPEDYGVASSTIKYRQTCAQ